MDVHVQQMETKKSGCKKNNAEMEGDTIGNQEYLKLNLEDQRGATSQGQENFLFEGQALIWRSVFFCSVNIFYFLSHRYFHLFVHLRCTTID